MTSKTFVPGTVIDSAWLNDVNDATYAADIAPVGSFRASLEASSGASLVGYLPAGTGATASDVETVLRETVSIMRFGALSTNTNAQNKTALQSAITAYAASGAVILIPPNICYGYKASDKTTWPSFAGVTAPMAINDFGPGASYAGFPIAYDGMQSRVFMFTPQTTSAGQHDGNTQWLRGAWSPNICLSNDMDLSGVRTALDNRRVGITLFVNGSATWKIGQGTTAGAASTDEVLSNFMVQKYAAPGDTLGDYSPLVVERLTGNMSYGGGANIPSAHHHFKPVTGSPNNYDMMTESLTGTVQHVLRTSTGASQDVILRNVGGVFGVNVPALGDALQVDPTTRRAWFPGSLQLRRQTAAYSASIAVDPATGNIFTITATNGTAFSIGQPALPLADGQPLTFTIRNASGGALGVATWSAAFKMASWTQPANGFSRSISFYCDGTNWIETSRTSSDVPN